MKKVGHTSEFLSRIYWWTWNLLEKLLNWANKKCKNLNIYKVVIFKKIKKNTWRYHYFTPVYQTSWWYDLQFLRYRVWETEIGNYGSFFAFLSHPENLKSQNFEKMKKIAGDIIILHICTKTTIIWGMVPGADLQCTKRWWPIFVKSILFILKLLFSLLLLLLLSLLLMLLFFFILRF